jgi:hypothetical protein
MGKRTKDPAHLAPDLGKVKIMKNIGDAATTDRFTKDQPKLMAGFMRATPLGDACLWRLSVHLASHTIC